jgi:succinyl-diaminopimelate desuccinylase
MAEKHKPEDQKLIELLQALIRIPSWVSRKDKQNENKLVLFLEKWLKENTDFEVVKQPLEGGRFNLIAKKGLPNLVFLAHTDTVPPSEHSPHGQFEAEIHERKIWGRGATDMKSGIASMAQALAIAKDTTNVWAIFYADEEYDFLGMKGLIKKYGDLKPKMIVSSDGSDLKIGNGCRGLIEIRGRVRGETGHAAKGNGLNAIDAISTSMTELKKYFSDFSHPVMGKTSLNLAYLLGGQETAISYKDNLLTEVSQEGNVIPDIAEFVIDVRPSSPDLKAKNITEFLNKLLTKQGYKFEVVAVRHDLGAWYTDSKELKNIEKIASSEFGKNKVVYAKPGESGYIDLQMFWETCGRPPAFIFGAGDGETAHKPNEYINIKNLIKERNFFLNILRDSK